MKQASFTALALRLCAFLVATSLVGACSGSSDDADDATTTDEEVTARVEDFFTTGDATSGTIDAGGVFELPDGGSLASTGDESLGVTVTDVEPTDDGLRAFTEWNAETEFEGPVFKLEVAALGSPPDYLIVTRPASDADSRIFTAAYIDADTGDPDWAPAPSQYDAEAGTVTAAVGPAVFQPLESGEPQVGELAALGRLTLQTTHISYIAVGVGGRSFRSEVELVVEEPSGPLELPAGSPPIPVASQVAARLIHITNKPLDTLTVTSDFGPRRQPVQGASTNHRGVDYRAANGTNVYAAGDGVVTLARCQLSSVNCGRTSTGDITGGFYVEITHGDGETTKYFHMTNPATVSVGDAITAGQVIGLSGSTGGVAPHLHFEVLKNGVQVDPELIFNEQVTTTIAMAIDFRVQPDSEQELNLVLGREISPGDLVVFDSMVDLTGVAPGEHALQFVAIHPNRSLQVLTYVPLTITGAFSGVTGSYTMARDVTETRAAAGAVDAHKEVTEATFSLVAVGENRLEGQGHVSYVLNTSFTRPDNCPLTTAIASVEWDVFYEGEFTVNPDGSIDLWFNGTPRYSPDYVFTQTSVGGCNDFTDTLSGTATPDVNSVTLVDGEYYYREDKELDENQTGEDYYEVVVDATNY